MPVRHNLSNYALALCGIILLLIVWFSDRKIAIDGDGKDYYSYLKAIFIDHNFTHQSGNDWFLIETPTGTINVHTLGVSLLMLPFFLIALGVSALSGYPADGVALPFQMAAFAAGIFYCLLGLFFLKGLLRQSGFSDRLTALILLLTCFGTNLLRFSVAEPAMSHVYSFAMLSLFLYYSLRWFQTNRSAYVYGIALVLGLIVLIRPFNGLVLLFLPMFATNGKAFVQRVKACFRDPHFYAGLLLFLAVCSFQGIAWYLQNGRFLQDSYQGNGFRFLAPQPWKMLFSFNNGQFMYVPLTLLFGIGWWPLFRKNRFQAGVLAIAWLILIYLLSAYWAYNYFDGLGIRVLVDFMPVFALCGAWLFREAGSTKTGKALLTVFALTTLGLNLLHHYQYQQGILQGNGMNFNKYRYAFLKTDRGYADSLGGAADMPPYTGTEPRLLLDQTVGEYDYRDKEFGLSLVKELCEKVNTLYVTMDFERKEEEKNASYAANLTIDISDTANTKKCYQSFRLNETPASACCEWKHYHYAVKISGKFEPADRVTVYVWNTRKGAFVLRNFNVKIIDYSYKL